MQREVLLNRIVLSTLFLLTFFGPTSAQWVEPVTAIHTFDGAAPGDAMGLVRSLGDLDGDGVPDIGIGVNGNDDNGENAGKVWIFSGATGDTIRTHVRVEGSHFGYDMASIGDLNGDGVPEYAVSAPRTANFITFNPGGDPRVFVIDGATGSGYANLRASDFGVVLGGGFGAVVSGLGPDPYGGDGDVDGDGIPDLMICANLAGGFVGQVWILSGASFSIIHTTNGTTIGGLFGFGGGGLGDINGDGRADYIVAAPDAGTGSRGIAHIYSGMTGLEFPFSPIEPDGTGARFGLFFADSPGDLNNDGTNDFFVGDFLDNTLGTNTGKIYCYSGVDGSLLYKVAGAAAGEGFGVVRGAGDVDFDGNDDLLVAAFSSSAGDSVGGQAFVLSGPDGSVLRTITGNIATDFFGTSVFPAGDMNSDGAIDFLFSSPGSNAAGAGAGRVYLVAGDIFPTTDLPELAIDARNFQLGRAYPNPTRGATTLEFAAPVGSKVRVSVHDVTGRRVATLLESVSSGTGSVTWNGLDDARRAVPAGVYYVRLTANGERMGQRVVRLN